VSDPARETDVCELPPFVREGGPRPTGSPPAPSDPNRHHAGPVLSGQVRPASRRLILLLESGERPRPDRAGAGGDHAIR